MAPGLSTAATPFAWAELSNNVNVQWWKDPGMRKCCGVIFLYMVAQATGGYDKSLINNLQSIPTWGVTLGNPSGGTLGLITAMLSIGVIAGSPLFGWLSDWKGRKITMIIGCFFMLVGAILQAAATDRSFFLGGRFLIGFGVAGTLCSGPLIVAEIAHPRQRGTVASFYNTFWYVGSIICAWLSFGTAYIQDSNWAWRIPCIGQAVPAFILMCVGYWLPESPRWLVKQGRREEALEIFARYHSNGDTNDPLVRFELAEVEETLAVEASFETKGWIKPWLDLVSSKPNRYRFFIITMLVIGIDWCGTSITSYYLSKILASVGIASATQQTGINGGLQIWNWITSVTGAMLAERVGRRTLWLASFGGMLAVNIPFGACSAIYAKRNNISAGRAVIFLIFMYNGAYNIGCNPLPYTQVPTALYTVEILPYAVRAKGLAYEVAWDAANGVLGQYTNPIALDALEWKFYFVYTAFLVCIVITVYFTFPETRGYTLEEICEVFGDSPGGDVGVQTVALEDTAAKAEGEKNSVGV